MASEARPAGGKIFMSAALVALAAGTLMLISPAFVGSKQPEVIRGNVARESVLSYKRGKYGGKKGHTGSERLPNFKSYRIHMTKRTHQFDEEHGMYDIIRFPLLSEKACQLLEQHNVYTFMVDRRANKPQIRAAVETIWNVEVQKCNTVIPPARYTKRYGMKIGRKTVYKKAFCKIKDGQTIDLFPDDPEQI
eukprot:CAMPEP_0197647714 /NCGR_PEP_ID=MMETSP1338-20131121/26260_1 /TAXON_ID=43686 ORGANISM="Pelagodinium beii, Strain RCC1491" /NCGR_SAMPLE_ID=MMETSP1338 /ASSEMBLY_ACC=CAM_ASM_000754 /LENGTH=191 /DNA_ID=CAMNT_0043221571 /DNA_START=68 /DNA_END=643 /DNA_ORIENTATION=+